jgi:hypothetical protein
MTTRVVATLRGLQIDVPVEDQCDYRHEAASSSHFENDVDDDGNPYGVVIFGPDIYPGTSLLDPNSELSMKAAVAHELSHFHRWRDATELTVGHNKLRCGTSFQQPTVCARNSTVVSRCDEANKSL